MLDIVIEVLDVEPPTIEVVTADGGDDFGICAGAELGVVASSEGGQEPCGGLVLEFERQFWDENTADIPFGGTFVVTGETASGCVVKETFQVFQTPFYLPATLWRARQCRLSWRLCVDFGPCQMRVRYS